MGDIIKLNAWVPRGLNIKEWSKEELIQENCLKKVNFKSEFDGGRVVDWGEPYVADCQIT